MNRIFFIVIYFLILQNFLLNSVLADSGFSSDFIEQAKKLGINIGQNLDQKVSDNDLSNTSNSQSIPDLKLPSLPKPEEKPDLKLPSPPKPEEKPDVKLPSPPKSEEKLDLKLPSPPKSEEKPDVKINVKADKVEDKKMHNNKKQELKQKVSKKLSNIMDKKNVTEVVKKPKTLPAKIIPKQKVKKSITYFAAPEEDIDNNLNN